MVSIAHESMRSSSSIADSKSASFAGSLRKAAVTQLAAEVTDRVFMMLSLMNRFTLLAIMITLGLLLVLGQMNRMGLLN